MRAIAFGFQKEARWLAPSGLCYFDPKTIYLTRYIVKKYLLDRALFYWYILWTMARVPITVMGYRCERCSHEWIPRDSDNGGPRVCPKCKSPYWDRPRQAKSMMTYEDFRDAIKTTLKEAKGPLTWTEIRTAAKLPQKFPNNEWVHRMEKDIGLDRRKDKHGVIHWQLG